MRVLTERYHLGECIGRGGVGEVYQGLQVALGRPVAIKLLRPELTRNRSAVLRFEREAQTTSLLNHPNIVTVIDVGQAQDGGRFVVMELLEGETLSERLARAKPHGLDVDEALHLARQVARGMAAGQGVALVHRDLKPENIFIVEGDRVKILDFGLATLLDAGGNEAGGPGAITGDPSLDDIEPDTAEVDPSISIRRNIAAARLTRPGTLMGTPRYMPPEQVLGWSIDHRSDLYSFGCVMYEVLTGHTMFPGPGARDYMQQHLHEPPPRLRSLNPAVPRPLARIIEKLVQKAPRDRFDDWAALTEALRQIAEETGPQRAAQAPRAVDPGAQPTEPYRFLNAFTAASRGIFFGRDADMRRFRQTWEHPDRPAVVVVTGASGVGKSSFLNARVIPSLEDTGHQVLRVRGTSRPLTRLAEGVSRLLARVSGPTAERPLPELLDALASQLRRPLAVIIDQAEEVFTSGQEADTRALQAGIAALIAGGDSRVRLVLSLREDYLGTLVRSMHPLPFHQIARTLALRPLEEADLIDALEGPGREGLAVRYPPFSFEPGLAQEIVSDLLADKAGEVAPRVQAIGARLWAMVQDAPQPIVITREHYERRLGRAQGILSRILDEAVQGLAGSDQGVAKELLRALTHLPGSPTSRPAPESELVAHAADASRRRVILGQLENRWRVVHGYQDARWPQERAYRIAHEALVVRIQQYGEEGSERNRARALFHQGLSLWLQGGRQEQDLLPEAHFEQVQGYIEDLVLRTNDEQSFWRENVEVHNESWMRRRIEQRRALVMRRLLFGLAPVALIAVGVLIGQTPVDFLTLRALRAQTLSSLKVTKADHSGAHLRGAHLEGAWLRAADLTDADLREADLAGADLAQAQLVDTRLQGADLSGANLQQATLQTPHLTGAQLRGADLRGATVAVDPAGADFVFAIYDGTTTWGDSGPPPGAMGPGGRAQSLVAEKADLSELDLYAYQAPGAVLRGADLSGSSLVKADLQGADLTRATLESTDLQGANLNGGILLGAQLAKAALKGADLGGADLRDADLDHAVLVGATLIEARLCGADLRGALLTGANFKGAVACETTKWPDGTAPRGVRLGKGRE